MGDKDRLKLWKQRNPEKVAASAKRYRNGVMADPIRKARQYGHHRKWRRKNRKRLQERNRQYLKTHSERARDRKLRLRYDLTPDQFIRLLKKQRGKCAVCNEVPRELVVDHCHASGRVRGLLCRNCNSLIGYAKDDPKRLLAAVAYLRKGVP